MTITDLENKIMRRLDSAKEQYLKIWALSEMGAIDRCKEIVADCFYEMICGKDGEN